MLWLGALLSTGATIPVAIAVQVGQPLSMRGLAIGVASGFVHCLYWWALARMYRRGDISLAYPIARGSGVLGTAVGSALWLREPLSDLGALGIGCVCGGVFALYVCLVFFTRSIPLGGIDQTQALLSWISLAIPFSLIIGAHLVYARVLINYSKE